MGQPHKHAALIKAWADGAIIEHYRPHFGWEECSYNTPCWSPETNYRIKPKTIRYRVALFRGLADYYTVTTNGNSCFNNIERTPSFIRWLGDWQEVEV